MFQLYIACNTPVMAYNTKASRTQIVYYYCYNYNKYIIDYLLTAAASPTLEITYINAIITQHTHNIWIYFNIQLIFHTDVSYPKMLHIDTNRNVHTLSQYECYFHQFRIAYIELSVYHHKIIPKCIQMQIV